MPADADFSDIGMTREDRILARVVLDLGLAKVSDIEGAAGKVKESGASLAQVLQETGCLKPRFLAAVEKVVKSRLATTKASGAERPSARMRAQRPPSSRHLARPSTDVEKQQRLPSLAMPRRPGRVGDVVRTTRPAESDFGELSRAGHPAVPTPPQAQGPDRQPPDERPSEGDPPARPKPLRPAGTEPLRGVPRGEGPPPSSQYMKEREARRRRRAKGWGRDGAPGT